MEQLELLPDLPAPPAAEPDRVPEIVQQIQAAPDAAAAVALLRRAVRALGVDAATFTSFVRDDATLASYRSLLACNPVWGQQYASNGWCLDDPWLRYALGHVSPARAEEIQRLTPQQRFVADAAAHFGFRGTLVVPVPTPAAQNRVGVLCLGSNDRRRFHGPDYPQLRLLARSLAMELGDWMHQHLRAEFMRAARITDDDLRLLRHQQQGHSSKVIAQALNTEAKTIDCRFQRLSLRLGAANRRAALRLAELYGLV